MEYRRILQKHEYFIIVLQYERYSKSNWIGTVQLATLIVVRQNYVRTWRRNIWQRHLCGKLCILMENIGFCLNLLFLTLRVFYKTRFCKLLLAPEPLFYTLSLLANKNLLCFDVTTLHIWLVIWSLALKKPCILQAEPSESEWKRIYFGNKHA